MEGDDFLFGLGYSMSIANEVGVDVDAAGALEIDQYETKGYVRSNVVHDHGYAKAMFASEDVL